MTLSGSRGPRSASKQVNFSWSGSPGAGVNADKFSVRWTGYVEATATGNFQFQTRIE